MDKNTTQNSPKHAILSEKFIFFLGMGPSFLPRPFQWGDGYPSTLLTPCPQTKPSGSAPAIPWISARWTPRQQITTASFSVYFLGNTCQSLSVIQFYRKNRYIVVVHTEVVCNQQCLYRRHAGSFGPSCFMVLSIKSFTHIEGTARRSVSIEISPTAAQLLYKKLRLK